jgi:CO/xanthine dehydrogenase Mo-binding subunit
MIDDVIAAFEDPVELRRRNLRGPEAMQFTNITNKHFDSGDYPERKRRAVDAIDMTGAREQPDPMKRRGPGVSIFCEQAAHGTSVKELAPRLRGIGSMARENGGGGISFPPPRRARLASCSSMAATGKGTAARVSRAWRKRFWPGAGQPPCRATFWPRTPR